MSGSKPAPLICTGWLSFASWA